MTSTNAMGVIFANMHDQNIPEIIARRTMASVPFAGRYRMVDFCLSGMANAGIQNIGVVVRQNYKSLMDHLGGGREWDLSRKRGGLTIFPPAGTFRSGNHKSRVESLSSIIDYLEYSKAELVVMSDCDIACNLDYSDLIRSHRASGADVSVVYEKSPIPESMLQDNIVYTIGEGGFVTDIRTNDYRKGSQNLSMCIYVINRELLVNLIKDAEVRGITLFEKEVLARSLKTLKVKGYHFTGYRARIYDMQSYYKQNLRLLKHENLEKLFPENRPVYTKVRDEAPVRYAIGARAKDCMVADGCIIEGELENCLLFRGVKIGKGAKLKNCIIMQGSAIEQDAVLENVVTDKNVVVTQGQVLRGTSNFPVFVAKGYRVL